MVSAVSFRSNETMDFSERIKQPQTFAIKEEPQAASSIKSSKQKSSGGKKFLKLLLTAAAVAGALAVAAKSGRFEVAEGSTGILNAIKSGINKAGNAVINFSNSIIAKIGLVSSNAATNAETIVENTVNTIA